MTLMGRLLNTLWHFIGIVIVFLAVFVGCIIFNISRPRAAECERYVRVWHHGNCNVSEGFFSSCRRGHWRHRCVAWGRDRYDDEARYRERDPRPERVYAYERRREENEPAERGQCKEQTITAVSDEHKNVDKARTDAVERWRKAVSWSGGGGEYMDYSLAINRSFRCGPSSPGDSWAAKGGKLAAKAYGSVTGATQSGVINEDGMNQRCQVWAVPCKARRDLDPGEQRP